MTSIAIDLADGLSSATAYKGPCKVATTANITLSGEQTIDGSAIVTGDRVLVRAQTTTAENGIYVADTGPWRRAKDFAGNRDVRKGSRVWVTEGDSGPTEYEVTTENPVVVGDDAIGFRLGALTEAAVVPIVQANVPIFASKAAAQGATGGIAAAVKNIQLQFYNPAYANLTTLVGKGYWSRMSKADIDAAGYPSLAYWRSIDRFLPDGSTDATNGGYWVLNDDTPTPQMLGLVHDSGVLDQTAIFQAWVTLCGILGKPCHATVPAWIKITDTVTFPTASDINIKQLRVTYSGTKDRIVLDIPSGQNRRHIFGIVEGDTADWTSDDYCGISFGNMTDCYIWLQLTRRFTVGYRLAPTGACQQNKIWPGVFAACKYMERIKSLGPGGFVNENDFYSGNYTSGSEGNALGPRYGTHIQYTHGGYNGHNNNIWHKPCYQMGNTAGDVQATPIFFDGAGGGNKFHDCRMESNVGPVAIFSGANVVFNEIDMNYGATWAQQINTIEEVNGANSNLLVGNKRYATEVRVSANNLHRLLSSYGGANSPYLRGDVFLLAASGGTPLRTTPGANQVRSNALALDLNGVGVFIAVDTTRIKQWRLNAGFIGALSGNVFAQAFDASGALLTGNSLDIDGTAWAGSTAYSTIGQCVTNDTGKIYRLATAGTSASSGGPTGTGTSITDGTCLWDYVGIETYIKNNTNGWAATSTYGGGYLHAGFSGGGVFSVRPEVATMRIGVYSCAPRSLEIIGYSTQETIDNTSGLTSVAAFVPLDDDGSVRLASAKPDTAGTHGYYSVGQIVYNSGATSGQPTGWQCTTAGWLAAAWAISTAYAVPGRIVENDTGKMYQLVTAGTSAGSGGPTGTGSAITDGTCVWDYVGVKAVFQAITSSGDLLSANNLSDLASAATARTNLGLTANGASLVTAANYAAMRTLLDLEAGTDFYSISAANAAFQAIDPQLSSLVRVNSQSAAYTLVLGDGGYTIFHPAADTTARIWTIPANASVAFPIGTVVGFDNQFGAGAITIAITSDTLELVGSAGSTGGRTLATGGYAIARKMTSTLWRISGQELT